MVSKHQINTFKRRGYTKLGDNSWLKDRLKVVEYEVTELARLFGITTPLFGQNLNIPAGEERTKFYRALRYLPSLSQLASCDEMIKISKSLGLRCPIVMNASNIRMDQGGANPNSFHWHQDYTYLLGSLNSVTYWIPMQKVNETFGGIEIVPGSHCNGLFPFQPLNDAVKEKTSHVAPKEICLVEPPKSETSVISMERGDLLVFSQFLLHRSRDHTGPHMRWTIQIRHSDISDPAFLRHGCPMGDTSTIFKNPALQYELCGIKGG